MRFNLPAILSVVSAIAAVSANTHSSSSLRRRHHLNRAHSSGGDSETEAQQNITARSLEKRFSGARLTFYDAGLGACGKVNSNSDHIVALNIAQWDGGSHCFETITLSANGQTTTATIMDQCPGCPFGGLDLARDFFTFYASESVGVLSGTWNFGGDAAPPPPPPQTTHAPPPPPPKTSSPVPPPPPPHTTSTEHKTTTTSHTSHSSSSIPTPSSSSTQSTLSASQSQGGSVSPTVTAAPVPSNSDNLAQMYIAFVQMGSLVVAGGRNGGP